MHPQYGYDWVKSVVCLADTMTQWDVAGIKELDGEEPVAAWV